MDLSLVCLIAGFVLMTIASLMAGGKVGFVNRLPSRPLTWAIPLVAMAAYLISFNLIYTAVVTFAFSVWRFPGWGLWFDLNQLDQTDDPRNHRFFEGLLNKVSLGNDYVAFTLRHLIFIIPGLVLFCTLYGHYQIILPVAMLFSIGMTMVYHVSYLINRQFGVPIAELLTGPVWGVFIMLGLTLA